MNKNLKRTLSVFFVTILPLLSVHLHAIENEPKPQPSDIADRGGGGHNDSRGGGGGGGGERSSGNHGANNNTNNNYNHNGYNNHNYGYQNGWNGGGYGGGYGYGDGDAGYVPYSQPSYDLDENAPAGEFSFDDSGYDYNSPNNSDSQDDGD